MVFNVLRNFAPRLNKNYHIRQIAISIIEINISKRLCGQSITEDLIQVAYQHGAIYQRKYNQIIAAMKACHYKSHYH